MRLVEPVFREFLHQVEDLLRHVGGQAVLGGPLLEALGVLRHLLRLFLAHGTAQQVGLAERIAC